MSSNGNKPVEPPEDGGDFGGSDDPVDHREERQKLPLRGLVLNANLAARLFAGHDRINGIRPQGSLIEPTVPLPEDAVLVGVNRHPRNEMEYVFVFAHASFEPVDVTDVPMYSIMARAKKPTQLGRRNGNLVQL